MNRVQYSMSTGKDPREELVQPVGLARHGRNDHRDLVSARLLFAHDIGHAPDAFGPGHRGAAKFHHDTGQA